MHSAGRVVNLTPNLVKLCNSFLSLYPEKAAGCTHLDYVIRKSDLRSHELNHF